jgi:hypothetical protein
VHLTTPDVSEELSLTREQITKKFHTVKTQHHRTSIMEVWAARRAAREQNPTKGAVARWAKVEST